VYAVVTAWGPGRGGKHRLSRFLHLGAGREALFAIWVGKLIAAQGKAYILQDEHFGHSHFMGAMLADGQDDMSPTQSAACAGMIGAKNGAR
jgi:hypothetical protein